MNTLIATFAGGLLAVVGIIGGVSAYEADPAPVPQDQLLTYADQ